MNGIGYTIFAVLWNQLIFHVVAGTTGFLELHKFSNSKRDEFDALSLFVLGVVMISFWYNPNLEDTIINLRN